jgi:hypothetical protein
MLMESKTARALVWSSALALSLTGAAHAQRSGYTQQVSLPEGTVLRAELNDRLSSVDSRPGDRFTGTIREDRDSGGLPVGTEVIGQVKSVRRASDRQPGTIDVDFQTLRLPNGRSYPITASLTSLDANSIRRTADGRLESRGSSSKDRTKFIGYGAGAGAIIGALSGGDLLTSALLGAAAGYLYGQLNKDKERSGRYADVSLKEGTEFGVELNQRLVVADALDRSGVYDDRTRRPRDRVGGRRYDSRYDRRADSRTNRSDTGYRDSDIRVYMNDRDVRFGDSRPFLSGGRVMVPLAPVLDATGYRHRYDSRAREVTVNGDRGDARLVVGQSYAWVDGERVRLDAPAQLIDGVLYVPVQFLEEATDIRADWDADRRTLRMTGRSRAL